MARNWRTLPSPKNPLANRHGGQQDPRYFGRAYSPDFPQDESLLEDVYARIREGTVPLDEIVRRLSANNIPPQVAFHPGAIVNITALGGAGAVELLPKNPDRVALIIPNYNSQQIVFSFDAPVGGSGSTVFAGIPIPGGTFFEESSGSVAVNSIWVGTNVAAPVFPIAVIAYEGMLSLTGNKRLLSGGGT